MAVPLLSPALRGQLLIGIGHALAARLRLSPRNADVQIVNSVPLKKLLV